MQTELKKIINVANDLSSTGTSGASTSEIIAAAFVLDRMEFLPEGYSVIEAWERIDTWQTHVKTIRSTYSYLLVPW